MMSSFFIVSNTQTSASVPCVYLSVKALCIYWNIDTEVLIQSLLIWRIFRSCRYGLDYCFLSN